MGASVKAEGFGDGQCARSHAQAALEAATLSGHQIEFEKLPAFRTPRCVRLIYIQFLDPGVAIEHLVTFTLQL